MLTHRFNSRYAAPAPLHCKRILNINELQKIRHVAKGFIVISSNGGSILHMPTCHVVDEIASSSDSDALEQLRWYADMTDAVHAASPTPCTKCDPGLKNKVDALNRSGVFLHAEVYRILKNLKYRTTTEHPVYVAPLVQDPLKRPRAMDKGAYRDLDTSMFVHGEPKRPRAQHGEAYPGDPYPTTITTEFQRALAESQQIELAKQRVLDIVTAIPVTSSCEMILPIEVKKTNPSYIDWMFMKYNHDEINTTVTVISNKDQGGLLLFKIPKSDLGCPALYVNKVIVNTSSIQLHAYDGAVPLALKSSQYEFKNRSLNDASTQVVEGAFGLITNKLIHQVSTGIGYDNTQIYLPTIVTTANLYSCNYDPDNFDVSTGLVSNAKIEEKKFLIYNCPTSVTATFPSQLTNLDSQKHVPHLIKWPVLVVQARSFEELLGLIPQITPDNC